MDIVFIEDLKIETVIGIYDWEKEIKQVVSLDLIMSNDNRKAAATDSIADTLGLQGGVKTADCLRR